jgi:hypothetical protein
MTLKKEGDKTAKCQQFTEQALTHRYLKYIRLCDTWLEVDGPDKRIQVLLQNSP